MKFDALYNAIISETRCVYKMEDFEELIKECKAVKPGGWKKYKHEDLSQKVHQLRKFGKWKYSVPSLYFFREEDTEQKTIQAFIAMVNANQDLSYAFQTRMKNSGKSLVDEVKDVLNECLVNKTQGLCTRISKGSDICLIDIPTSLGLFDPYEFEEVFCHEFTHFLQLMTGKGFSKDYRSGMNKGKDIDGLSLNNGAAKPYSMKEVANRSQDPDVKGKMTIAALADKRLLDLDELLGIDGYTSIEKQRKVFNEFETVTYFGSFCNHVKMTRAFSSGNGLPPVSLKHFRMYGFKKLIQKYGFKKKDIDTVRKETKTPLDMVNNLIKFRNMLASETGEDSSKLDLKMLPKYAMLFYPEVFSLQGEGDMLIRHAEVTYVLVSIALMQNLRFLKINLSKNTY